MRLLLALLLASCVVVCFAARSESVRKNNGRGGGRAQAEVDELADEIVKGAFFEIASSWYV